MQSRGGKRRKKKEERGQRRCVEKEEDIKGGSSICSKYACLASRATRVKISPDILV